jgi:excisionase family DNA binding protein
VWNRWLARLSGVSAFHNPGRANSEADTADGGALLLTARQVAEALGVSCETVLRWTRRGELPAFRLPGGALRYRSDALRAWLAARATDHDEQERTVSAAPAADQPKVAHAGKRHTQEGSTHAADAAGTGIQTRLW